MPLQYKLFFHEGKKALLSSVLDLSIFLAAVAKADSRMATAEFFREGFDDYVVSLDGDTDVIAERIAGRLVYENREDITMYPGLAESGTAYESEIGFILGYTFRLGGLELSFTGKVGASTGNGVSVLADNGAQRADYCLLSLLHNCARRHPGVSFSQIQPKHIRLLRLYRKYQIVLGVDNFISSNVAVPLSGELPGFTISRTRDGIDLQSIYRPSSSDVDVPDSLISVLTDATNLFAVMRKP